ncbi:unnamed protein product [Urochloa humidicola]
MLLRSASSPLLNCARAPASAVEHHAVVSPSVAAAPRQGAVLCRAMSDGDLAAQLLVPAVTRGRKDGEAVGGHVRAPRLSLSSSSASISVEEEDGEGEDDEEYAEPEVAVAGGRRAAAAAAAADEHGQGGGNGGKARGGTKAYGGERGGDAAGDGGGRNAAGEHYRQMIEADPGNPLLLVNYARFLKEEEEDEESDVDAEPAPPPPAPFLAAAHQHPTIKAAS